MTPSALPISARRWLRRTLAGALLPLVAASATRAETYIQSVNHNGSGDWHTLAHWNTNGNKSPAGTSPVSINSGDHFVSNTNAWILRTGTGVNTFAGGSLALAGTHVLEVRSGASMSTVPNLLTRGSPSYLRAGHNNSTVTVQNLNVESGTLTINGHSTTASNFNVTVNNLVGKGDITHTGAGINRLSLLDATSYQGTMHVPETRKVAFMTPVSSGGALVAPDPANVTFNHDGVFTGLTVNGTTYPPDTYNANGLGFAGPSSATVTVRTPATWYLGTNQTSGSDWTQAFASHWKANSNGSGASAPSINIIDTYIHNIGTNALRTPATSSVFLGGSLTLGGSAQLVLAGGSSAISTVPTLATTGGTIVGGGAERNLAVDRFTATSGTTSITTTSGGVVNLFVGDLVGAGNLTLSGVGTFRPFIDHANHYTGTITVNNGSTLHVQTKFGIGGKLVVNSGGNVSLTDYAYVTALTVAGAVKPVGTYTATDLGSGFTGPGRVVVYNADLTGPAQLFGVNLAGAEFTGGPFWQTNPAIWDYYNNKGLTLIRLPFKWRHIQPTLNGAVNFTKLNECMTLARDRGMKVILDMHDYSRHASGDEAPLLGSAGLPISAFVDVWSKIAQQYKNDSALWGYDLMNEPRGTIEAWADAAQQATDGIRKHDQKAYVLVEGMSSSSAHRWPTVSGSLDIKDPVGRLIYSAHSYWDTLQSTLPDGKQNWGGDGIYINNEPRNPMAGVNQAAPFVAWLQTRPYAHGNFGEYGVPHNYNSADWNIVLANFLQYLRDNNISGTYWAGGSHWGDYQLSCHPVSLTSGPERPQMAVLELFNNTAVPAEVIVDNLDATFVGTWVSNTHVSGYYGTDYQHDDNAGKGTKTAQFTPNLPAAGTYQVFMRWPAGWNRATNAPVTITHAGGTASTTVNQQQNNNTWYSLGTFNFAAGTAGNVTLSNTGTTQHVMADAVRFTPVSVPVEVIVDNLQATLTGTWVSNTHVSGYYGTDYYHDNNADKGTKTAQFTPNLPEAGSYQVFMRWTAASNRANNAPVTIIHAGGTASTTVNQKNNNNVWVSLGTFNFAAGTAGSVILGTTGTTEHVIADAVRFVR